MSAFPTFTEFYRAATGNDPYRWQVECAEEVARSGWPATIDIPTGLGKTSCIHIAVYELARQLHEQLPRTAPLRIFHVIDRNSVVQQSAAGVAQLTTVVNEATDGPLLSVRTALESAVPPASVLPMTEDRVAISRASYQGTRRDGDRVRAFGCAITSMTAHQFVSRLLFRGFGISAASRSIEAGLVGIDSLVLLDEPHLSRPTLTTISDVVTLQERSVGVGLPGLRLVTLGATAGPRSDSATSGAGASGRYEAVASDPRAAHRIAARRSLEISTVSGKSDKQFAAALARHARDSSGDAVAVGVIVNTIAVAHLVAAELRRTGVEVDVVTSRIRPLDRTFSLDDSDHLAGRVTVATQCIEVGVDLSFDVLITEACPLPSLIQRIGRLNRDGNRRGTGYLVTGESKGEIAIRAGSAAVYGEGPILATLNHLTELVVDGVLDASIAAQRLWNTGNPDLWPAKERHATLTPAAIPYLTLTKPRLPSDINIDAYILGPDTVPSIDVRVAWRADLDALNECPPGDDEFITLPIGAVRTFLRGQRTAPVNLSDAGGGYVDEAGKTAGKKPQARVRVRRNEWHDDTSRLAPGSDIVVSAADGGYSSIGWNPESKRTVTDLSAKSALVRAGTTDRAFPVSTESLVGVLNTDAAKSISKFAGDLELSDPEDRDQLRAALEDMLETSRLPSLDGLIGGVRIARIVEGAGGIAIAQVDAASAKRAERHRGSLDDHLRQVCLWSFADARAIGLQAGLVESIAVAGLHHDTGKSASTWQRLATGGNPPHTAVAAFTKQPPAGRFDLFSRSVGCPPGWRHEALSFDELDSLRADPLAAHLTASHHGWFRPFAPPVDHSRFDLEPPEIASQLHGADHAAAFNELNRVYGPWGLAYLEAVLRLADHRAAASPLSVVADELPVERPAARTASEAIVELHETPLTGLTSTPTAAWFAIVGLLAAAERLGTVAEVRWESPSGSDVRPSIPVLRTELEVRAIIDSVWRSGDLVTSDKLAIEVLGEQLVPKYHKIRAGEAVRELLKSCDETTRFITGIINDTSPAAANGKLELSTSAISNNSSFGAVALEALGGDASTAFDALFDPAVGYSIANCDGGFDRDRAAQPLVNGIGEHGQRASRTILAPLVMEGFAALGTPPEGGHGVADRTLSLPLPTRFTGLDELRALTYIGRSHSRDRSAIDCNWFLVARYEKVTQYDAHWDAAYQDVDAQRN